MGIITSVLFTAGYLKTFEVPKLVIWAAYIAIAAGLGRSARNKLTRSTEMRHFSNAQMVFVFGL